MIPILFYIISILVIVIDQLSKYLIRAQLTAGETIEIWDGVLNFTLYFNSGAAFGLFEGYGRLFVPVAIFVTTISIYLLNKGYLKGKMIQIGVALFVGGAIGNAVDRTLFNEVTDFIDFSYNSGILNLADYALNFGFILILIDTFIIEPIKKRKKKDQE